MSYLYVSKKKHAKSSKPTWIVVLAFVFVVGAMFMWSTSLFSMFTSWWKGESQFLESSAAATNWFGDKVELAVTIDELQEKNSDLKAELARLKAKANAFDDLVGELTEIEEDNDEEEIVIEEDVEAETGTSTSTTTPAALDDEDEEISIPQIDGTLAKIIRRPPFTLFDTYVIDKGNDDGIAIGEKAFARNIPVGVVESVTDTNATVKLFSSPGEKILVSFGTSSTQYEAYGIGNATLKSDVPRDASIEVGMEATSDDSYLSIVGNVEAIEKEENSTSKAVFINLPFDIAETGWLIIRKD